MEKFDKLQNFYEVKYEQIREGDHFRYTCKEYKKESWKCVYAICLRKMEGRTMKVKGFKSMFGPWVIEPNNKFKAYRFYKQCIDVTPNHRHFQDQD